MPRLSLSHKSVVNTTSTGPGTSMKGNFRAASIQVTRTSTGIVTAQMEGSLDGTNWTNLGAAATAAVAGTVLSATTGAFLVTHLRATLTTHAAVGKATIWIAGSA